MHGNPDVQTVLSHYPLSSQPLQIDPLANPGGWSGSSLWRITAAGGQLFCLRRWPVEHPTPDRLRLIHNVLKIAADGLPVVACPLATTQGATFICHASRLWELTRWMPGAADYHVNPTPARLRSAMHALACFHDLAKRYKTIERPAPAVLDRIRRFELLDRNGLEILKWSLTPPLGNLIDERAHRLMALLPVALSKSRAAQSLSSIGPLLLQPAIRDIHHDHVLFTGDDVTGLIDFGALRIDTPLADIARLLGSLVGDDRDARRRALDAYAELRPLTKNDRRFIDLLDGSGLLIAALNWLTWLYVERRDMGPSGPIARRLDALLARLENQLV